MILDAGILTIYRRTNAKTPRGARQEMGKSWYGELEYASSPYGQERINFQEERRVRIHQDRRITGLCVVELEDGSVYEVARAFHGVDEESGERISDLTLSRVDEGG